MCLYDPDNDVLTPAASANTFAEHAVGLPDTRSVSEKYLETAVLLLRFTAQEPVFG
jgi:hypothetical protein